MFGPKTEWIKAQPCMVCWGKPSDPHHYPTRGSGRASVECVTPLCRLHHNEFHAVGVDTFQDKYSLDMMELNLFYENLWRMYDRSGV